MANNIDIKDFTLGTARTMKTIETAGVNVPLHAIDQTTPGTTDSVTVKSQAQSATVSFTCGTTAYAAQDVVGAASSNAAVDFVSMGPSGKEILITSASLEIDATAIISGETSYVLHLYNVTPPSAINDSSPFTLGASDRSSYLGNFTLGSPVVLGVTTSTLYVEVNGINKQVKLAGTDLFGYLVSNGAYTPTARVFKITLHTVSV